MGFLKRLRSGRTLLAVLVACRPLGRAGDRRRLDVRCDPRGLAGARRACGHVVARYRGQAAGPIGSGEDQGAAADADGGTHADRRRNREQGDQSRASDPNVPLPQRQPVRPGPATSRRPAPGRGYSAAARMAAGCWACDSPFRPIAMRREPPQDSAAKPRKMWCRTAGPESGQEARGAKKAVLPLSHSTPLSRRCIGHLPCTSLVVVCIFPSELVLTQPRQRSSGF